MAKLSKSDRKRKKAEEIKQRKQSILNPMGRVRVSISGIKIEQFGDFIFVEDSADLIEKIVQCARAGLTDNQIITSLKLKREIYFLEVEKKFKNSGNMFFLISLLPDIVYEYEKILKYWEELKVDISNMLNKGIEIKEISEKYGLIEEDVYRYISIEIGKVEDIRNKLENVKTINSSTNNKEIQMKKYAQLLGFNGLHFDYTNIDNNIRKDIPKLKFEEFLKKI